MPPVGLPVRVVVAPAAQSVVAPVTATTGNGVMVSVTRPVSEQPVALVPVTVYVVVVEGLAVTVAPVVAESPVDGLQVYVPPVPAPVPVRLVLVPIQMLAVAAVAETVGGVQPVLTVPSMFK